MGDDLYREICRCPGDDTLRLVYADWLDENDRGPEARFIRSQFAGDVCIVPLTVLVRLEWLLQEQPHQTFRMSDSDRTTVRTRNRLLDFRRGFPDSVSCTLAEAFAQDGVPTPWACEVVRRTPVTRFVLADKTPLEGLGGDDGDRFRWWGDNPEIGRTTVFRYVVPHWLFSHLDGESKDWEFVRPEIFCWQYSTERAAVDALALAAGRLVRRHVYGEVGA